MRSIIVKGIGPCSIENSFSLPIALSTWILALETVFVLVSSDSVSCDVCLVVLWKGEGDESKLVYAEIVLEY